MSAYCICAEYIHCLGRTVHQVATVDSEKDAVSWIRARSAEPDIPSPPEEDPSCFCKVTHCPLKIQRPRYFYRSIDQGCS